MAEAVERVERERERKERLARVLDRLREVVHKGDDVRGRERVWRDEVRERVAVQHYAHPRQPTEQLGRGEKEDARTERETPVTRLKMEPTQVSWGW